MIELPGNLYLASAKPANELNIKLVTVHDVANTRLLRNGKLIHDQASTRLYGRKGGSQGFQGNW
jgi:hypothetical protein